MFKISKSEMFKEVLFNLKKQVLIFICFPFSYAVCAETDNMSYFRSKDFSAKEVLRKGVWEFGGTFGIEHSESKVDPQYNSNYLNISPKVGYFFTDNISVGLTTTLSASKNHTNYTLAPQFKYYFYKEGYFATHFSQSVSANKNSYESSADWSGTSSVGAIYLLNPSIALGMDLNYSYDMGKVFNSAWGKYQTVQLLGSIHTFF